MALTNFLILFSVWLGGLTIFHLLELKWPVISTYRTGVTRRGYWADVTSTIVNGPGLTALEKLAFSWLITLVPAATSTLAGWHWWAQFGLFFIVNDFLRYWFHRWYHESSLLWRIHRVHHTVVEMDALSVFRHHVLEAIVKNGLIFLPFRLLGVSESVIIAYSALDIFKGFWHHANLRTYIGPLNYIFNSPELHWWHHSVEGRGQMSNYGSVLSVWDWLFGTAYWPKGEWPKQIGVAGLDKFPEHFVGQLVSVRHDDDSAARLYSTAPPPESAAAAPNPPPAAAAAPAAAVGAALTTSPGGA